MFHPLWFTVRDAARLFDGGTQGGDALVGRWKFHSANCNKTTGGRVLFHEDRRGSTTDPENGEDAK
ncbi:MAG: hypothetical protein ACRDD1_03670 [Planctomycetia bacterium]